MQPTTLLIPLLAATTLAMPTYLKPRCTPCEFEELAGGALNAVGSIAGGAISTVADVGLPIIGGLLGGGGRGGGSTTVSSSTHSSSSGCQPCQAAAQRAARMMARGMDLMDRMGERLYPRKE